METQGPPPPVDVVLCSWDGDDAALTLHAVAVCAQQAPRTILVDMSSTASAIATPAEAIPGVHVLHMPGSRGLGESRERGLEASGARYVAFLDSDAVPRPGWLHALHDAVRGDGVAVAGGPVLPVWPEERPPGRLFASQAAGDFLSMLDLGPQRRDVPRVLPGNMAVDRELTGPDVFRLERGRRGSSLVGAEEIDMMLRMADAGLRIVYTPGAAVDHHTTADRHTWRWFWRRVHAAGREAAVTARRLEPLPRSFGVADYAFLAAVTPAYAAGRWRTRRVDESHPTLEGKQNEPAGPPLAPEEERTEERQWD